jgi:hypothetical protein
MEKSGGRTLYERRHLLSTSLKTASKAGMRNFDGLTLHFSDILTSPIADDATSMSRQGASFPFPTPDRVPLFSALFVGSTDEVVISRFLHL